MNLIEVIEYEIEQLASKLANNSTFLSVESYYDILDHYDGRYVATRVSFALSSNHEKVKRFDLFFNNQSTPFKIKKRLYQQLAKYLMK